MTQDEPLQAGERLHGERLRRAFDRHRAFKAKQAELLKQLEREYPPARTNATLPTPANTYGSFFGPNQKVVLNRVIEQAQDKKKRKASGSPPPKKGAKGEVVLKSATKVEHPKKKLKRSRTDHAFLHTDKDPTVTYVPLEQDRGNRPLSIPTDAIHAKQTTFKAKEEKVTTNREANVKGPKAPIQILKGTRKRSEETLSMQVRTREDLPSRTKSTTPAKTKEVSSRVTPNTPSTTRKLSSSITQDLKDKERNKSLSLPKKVSSYDAKIVKDIKDIKKLPSTFKGQTSSKQINNPRKQSIDNKIDELEDDLEGTVSHATKKNYSKQRKRKQVVSDSDDDMEGFEDIRASIHATMGYDASKYVGRDDEDDSDMEADFETIEREERRSERIGKAEDDKELALIRREEEKEIARKKSKKALNKCK